jgi:hypothetical protein
VYALGFSAWCSAIYRVCRWKGMVRREMVGREIVEMARCWVRRRGRYSGGRSAHYNSGALQVYFTLFSCVNTLIEFRPFLQTHLIYPRRGHTHNESTTGPQPLTFFFKWKGMPSDTSFESPLRKEYNALFVS